MLECCCLAAPWWALLSRGSSRGLPWSSKLGTASHVQVASSRRGLKNQLKTLLWRSKSSAAAREQEARDGSQTPRGAVAGQPYAAASMEGQLRQLADLAFMMQDYETAVSTLKLLSSDARADKAWKAYAGAQVRSCAALGRLCLRCCVCTWARAACRLDPSVCLAAQQHHRAVGAAGAASAVRTFESRPKASKMPALMKGSMPCTAAPLHVQSSDVCVDAATWLRRRC